MYQKLVEDLANLKPFVEKAERGIKSAKTKVRVGLSDMTKDIKEYRKKLLESNEV